MTTMIAAILAGGKGTRMDILCQTRAKPALPFAGKYKVIDFNLSSCFYSDIKDIGILVDYQREGLNGYVRKWRMQNAPKFRIDMLEPGENASYCGTADALYQNLDYLRQKPANRVLIMPSDQAYKMDYRKMLQFHEKSGAEVTVGVVPVPIEEASRFGTLSVRDDGRVTEYAEKPDEPKSNLVSTGIYIFNKDILIKKLREDAAMADSLHDFGFSIIPGMVDSNGMYAYKFDGYWRDIGTIDSYYATSLELLGKKPPFQMNGTWPVLTGEVIGPVVKGPLAQIENSIVSPGCVIKGRVENSVLSPGILIDEHAVVKNSILLAGAYIGYHTVIDGCIIDEKARVGEYCYIGFGNERKQTTPYTLIGAGAVIDSHSAIARGSKIMPFSRPDRIVGGDIDIKITHTRTLSSDKSRITA